MASEIIGNRDGYAHESHVVQSRPFHRQGQAQSHARRKTPPPEAHAGAKGAACDAPLRPHADEALLHLLVVADDEIRREAYEKRLGVVQHAGATGDEQDAVAQRDDAGREADEIRARQAPGDGGDEEDDGYRAQRADDTPAPRRVAEDHHPERFHLLGQWWVNDQSEAGVILNATDERVIPAAGDLPRLWHIMLFVEDGSVRVRRAIEHGQAT